MALEQSWQIPPMFTYPTGQAQLEEEEIHVVPLLHPHPLEEANPLELGTKAQSQQIPFIMKKFCL